MYKLLRRISSSFKERFDWSREGGEDGATSSTTPQTGSKRRMSDDEDVPNGSLSKRSRGAHDDDRIDASELGEVRQEEGKNENESEESVPTQDETRPREETEDVRQVRKGVKEVELEDKKGKGKEVVEEASEEEDGDKVELTTEKSEDAPEEEPKPEETVDAKEVTDAEPTADEPSESSKNDVPIRDATISDSPESPAENKAVHEEPADASALETETVTATEPIPSATTTTTSPTKPVVPEPEPVSEPLPAIASSEAPVKVQG